MIKVGDESLDARDSDATPNVQANRLGHLTPHSTFTSYDRHHVRSVQIKLFHSPLIRNRTNISYISSNPFTTFWRVVRALPQCPVNRDARSVIGQGKREGLGWRCSRVSRGETEKGSRERDESRGIDRFRECFRRKLVVAWVGDAGIAVSSRTGHMSTCALEAFA
jgi:hypothetical protein